MGADNILDPFSPIRILVAGWKWSSAVAFMRVRPFPQVKPARRPTMSMTSGAPLSFGGQQRAGTCYPMDSFVLRDFIKAGG